MWLSRSPTAFLPHFVPLSDPQTSKSLTPWKTIGTQDSGRLSSLFFLSSTSNYPISSPLWSTPHSGTCLPSPSPLSFHRDSTDPWGRPIFLLSFSSPTLPAHPHSFLSAPNTQKQIVSENPQCPHLAGTQKHSVSGNPQTPHALKIQWRPEKSNIAKAQSSLQEAQSRST